MMDTATVFYLCYPGGLYVSPGRLTHVSPRDQGYFVNVDITNHNDISPRLLLILLDEL
jgi:hypothetical protein